MQFIFTPRSTSSLFLALALGVVVPVEAAPTPLARISSTEQSSVTETAPGLVRAATMKPAETGASREILRSRAVELDLASLKKIREALTAGQPAALHIALFDDVALSVHISRSEQFGINGTAYIGSVAGIALSSVVIVEEDGVVSGNINVLSRKYQIRSVGDAGHVMREIDASVLPPDHVAQPASHSGDSAKMAAKALNTKTPVPPQAARTTALDDGSIIDVMVVYTPAARISQGSTAAMKSLINLAVVETNNTYANSLVTQRVRLVYAGEVNYIENNFATDLSRLQGTNDGFMDDIHELRNLYGADIVSLWGNYPAASGCGLSNIMSTESVAFADQAFNVVDRNCAGSNYSFAHELGHNMGLNHDTQDITTVTPEGSSVATQINYAHGYVDVPNRFRSVMATNSQCDAQMPAINCLRIPYFSNPAVNFDNRTFFPGAAASAPTGVFAINNPGSAHASRALNDTRDTTANFRMSVDLTGPGTIIFSPVTYTVSESAGSVTLSASRHAGTTGAVSASYSTVNGTAAAPADFTAQSGVLNWAAGEAGTKTITVPILQDGVLEGPEAFTVTLATPTGGVSIGVPGGTTATATVNIIDGDTDSFPVGCTLPLTGWSNPPAGATAGWSVATDSFFGPPCSLKSNPTADGNKAQIQFNGNFTGGIVSFARRVSSQAGGDCLRFFIDGVAQDIGGTCASGEVAWGIVSAPITTAGMHTLTWSYEKDGSGAAGADAAWIDRLVMPLAGPPVIQSAPPPDGFLNIPYSYTIVSSGSPTISYARVTPLPAGLSLDTGAGVISGTPSALGSTTFRIKATNGILPLDQKDYAVNITGAAPGAPIIGTAAPDNGRATLTFAPPVSAGSAAITAYTATCNPNAFTATNATSPITLTSLVNGTEYSCAVTATNLYGTSASSQSVLVMPLPTRPGAPAIGTPTPGNAQAFIAFTPPATDGGSPITSYTATCNPGAITGTAAYSPVTVSGLVNMTAYTCAAIATNAIGASVASATATVTPSAMATLSLIGAVSRKTHGTAGTYDALINTVAGPVSVEPRNIGSGHSVWLSFNDLITVAGTLTVADSANANVTASAMAQGNDVIVTIPLLADNTRVTISLSGVNGNVNPFVVSIGFLVGDVNNTRSVNSSDISGVKARSGQATNASNFRFDVNATGAINSSDISAVKARSGLVLP